MQRLTPIKPEEMARLLRKLGFRLTQQKGSHAVYEHPDGRTTVLPMHRREMAKGTLRSILRDIGISVEEYDRLRRKI